MKQVNWSVEDSVYGTVRDSVNKDVENSVFWAVMDYVYTYMFKNVEYHVNKSVSSQI